MPKPAKALSALHHPVDTRMEPDRGRSLAYAAQALGVSRSMASKLVSTGELASYKIGRRRIVKDSTLDAYLRSKKV